jgi:hypothetical protein
VDNRSFITADAGLASALESQGAVVLKIKPGSILLPGFDYGFIGGCSGRIGNTIFFFGNIKMHSDYSGIKDYIMQHNSKIEILCDNMPLTDIGGFVEVER